MMIIVSHYYYFFWLLQETQHYGTVLRVHDAVGVIGIACPDESPLLSFVSLFAPAFIRGNTILIVPSEKYPLPALQLYQVPCLISLSYFLSVFVLFFWIFLLLGLSVFSPFFLLLFISSSQETF